MILLMIKCTKILYKIAYSLVYQNTTAVTEQHFFLEVQSWFDIWKSNNMIHYITKISEGKRDNCISGC